MENKVTLRIPTKEQYSYVEVLLEGEFQPNDVVKLYQDYTAAFNAPVAPETALGQKEFNNALDEYLATNSLRGGVELWEKMSPAQKMVINEIKKAVKRQASHEQA